MKAIETRELPMTDTKPRRIKASEPDGKSATLSLDRVDGALDRLNRPVTDYNRHDSAALTLASNMGWRKHGRLVGGKTRKGYTFVFITGEPQQ